MKYKSKIYEALHEDTLANFKVGAISEAELREFEDICFVQENKTVYEDDKYGELSVQVSHATA